MFNVTNPASSLALLSSTELRSAIKAPDGSQDTALAALEPQIAAAIMGTCKIASDGVHPPTLLKETCKDTFRRRSTGVGLALVTPMRHLHHPRPDLMLSRRPIISVASITENDGTPLDPAEYEILNEAGIVRRLRNDRPSTWNASKTIVTYDAGFTAAPAELKLAAAKWLQNIWFDELRDTNLRRDRVEGVGDKEFYQDLPDAPDVPGDIMQLLERFMNDEFV